MSRTAAILFVTLSATTALTISACSSGDVPVGSSSQALKKTPKGNATGNGTTCSWEDTVSYDVATGKETVTPNPNGEYKVGDTFKSSDGCNDCSCTAQGIACTERACDPGPGGGTCSYDGKTYAAGQSFKSTDGCNSCGCQADGTVACTEIACAPAQACKKTGCSGQLCSDQDVGSTCEWNESYACYATATCARQANGQCGFTQTAELTSCLASKK